MNVNFRICEAYSFLEAAYKGIVYQPAPLKAHILCFTTEINPKCLYFICIIWLIPSLPLTMGIWRIEEKY